MSRSLLISSTRFLIPRVVITLFQQDPYQSDRGEICAVGDPRMRGVLTGLVMLTVFAVGTSGCSDPRLGTLKAQPSRKVYQPDDEQPATAATKSRAVFGR